MTKVLITGGTGLVGQRLAGLFQQNGYVVHILSRSRTGEEDGIRYFNWSVENGTIDRNALEVDHIVHLAGAGVADKRWTESRKRAIRNSRVKSAVLLENKLVEYGIRPSSIVCASAVGYYGSRGSTVLNEDSGAGSGFLPEVCLEWEASSRSMAEAVNSPLAIFRIGIVLSSRGGALPKLSMPLKLGIGAYLGDGRQYYPWIHIDDLCHMMRYAVDQKLDDVYNAGAPEPVTNKQLCKAISKVLHRPFIPAPTPGFVLRLVMGEMADMLLNSQRTSSERIRSAGFEFKHPDLEEALKDIFQREI